MSQYKKILIETSVDRLVHLVKREGKVTLSRASQVLDVDEKQLEEWVRILEEHGILELRYPALGEPELVLKQMPEQKIFKRKERIEKHKEKVEKKVVRFQEKSVEVEKRVVESDRAFKRAEEDLKRKLDRVERDLKKMKEYETQRKRVLREANELKRIADMSAQSFSEVEISFEYMDRKINEELKRMVGHEKEITNLEEVRKNLEKEIIFLDKEMKILGAFIKKPIRFPSFRGFERIFRIHRKKTKKIKKKKKQIHNKITKTKKKIKAKRIKVKKRKKIHKKLFERKRIVKRPRVKRKRPKPKKTKVKKRKPKRIKIRKGVKRLKSRKKVKKRKPKKKRRGKR
jgi:hypothetical protein